MLFCPFTSINDMHEGVHGDFIRSIRKGNDCVLVSFSISLTHTY